MTTILYYLMIFLGVAMELTSDAGAVPLQLHKRDDIIAGQDFLSVFIAGSSRLESQRPQVTTTTSTTSLPSTGYNEDALRPISRGSRSSMYHEDIVDNMNNGNAEKRNKHEVLPLEIMFTNVNSDGSEQKITMEELEAASSNSFESKLENSHTISADIQSKLRELYAEHQSSNAYSHSTLAPYVDRRQNQTEKQYRPAQVISISVSSSVGVSQVHKSLITTALPPIETTMPSLSNYNSNEKATNISSNEDFVILSNSNKSEFTIEEDPPRTKDNDYNKGSATNMHSVLAPSEQTVGANEAYIEQQRSRHHRRQEPNHPYHQRVIYHTDPKDDTGPRSVSYSTVVQTINQHHDRWEQVPDHKYSPQPEKAYDPQMQYAFNNTEPETILPNPEKLQSPPEHVYSEPSKIYSEPEKVYSEPAKIYSEPAKNYGEPSKVYSEPAKVYSEPARVYGVPEKVYSEPAKIYSEPAKIYSEPSKIYSEPAKIYSEPAKVYNDHPREIANLNPHNFRHGEPQKQYIPTAVEAGINQNHRQNMYRESFGSSVKSSYDETNAPQEEIKTEDHQQTYDEHGRSNHKQSWDYPQQVYRKTEHPVTDPSSVSRPQIYDTTPEQNYEVDEAVSVMTNGRAHGIQPSSKEDDNQKKGYVVEGRNFRKYRVEERTSDGFIVGEYGVVSHDDGSLRGVRYTADGTINPRLIYDALMKFLSL